MDDLIARLRFGAAGVDQPMNEPPRFDTCTYYQEPGGPRLRLPGCRCYSCLEAAVRALAEALSEHRGFIRTIPMDTAALLCSAQIDARAEAALADPVVVELMKGGGR